MLMLIEYINKAMSKAVYEKLQMVILLVKFHRIQVLLLWRNPIPLSEIDQFLRMAYGKN